MVALTQNGKVSRIFWCETVIDAHRERLKYCDKYKVQVLNATFLDDISGYTAYAEVVKSLPCGAVAYYCVTTQKAYNSLAEASAKTRESRYYIRKSCNTSKQTPSGRLWMRVIGRKAE